MNYDREHDLPITKQAEILRICRGGVYYLPRQVSGADLAIMQRLKRLPLEVPFAGSRILRGLLVAEGARSAGVSRYPYPLGGMAITRSSILRIGYFPKESSI